MSSPLDQALATLNGVGPRLSGRLARLGLQRVRDLLFHLPLRYQDRTRLTPLGALRAGGEVLVQGEVLYADVTGGRRPALVTRLADGTGLLDLRFFHYSAGLRDFYSRGRHVRCFGELRPGPGGLEMVHPECRAVDPEAPAPLDDCLTAVYPTTEGLHQNRLRGLVAQALRWVDEGALADLLPAGLSVTRHLPSLPDALHYVHAPPPDAPLHLLTAGCHPAQQRLAFEELLAQHFSLRRLRERATRREAPSLRSPGALQAEFERRLPFALTGAQRRVIADICADLRKPSPMQRLVQGDVGSGKTVVAAAAVLQAVEAGFQAAVMAPTELLAEQHLRNFSAWLTPLGLSVAGLVGKLGAKARRELGAALAVGELSVVVGTHALFQDGVEFAALGLVVIDEQHRFGVHQRLALWEKGRGAHGYPHQLVMTATPIPRTLAMTAYADLDHSAIDELPPGRTPVETVAVPDSRRIEVIERVRAACAGGRQAYWVCPLVEESEALQCQAAQDTAAALRQALPELRVGLVHGRLKGEEKEVVMQAFKRGDIDLLVATTVIEVGVDVPKASLMVIDNAERLGLAQLHQLRGRVGRGSEKSVCVLVYHPPLSRQGRARLGALRDTHDGFEIARRDLELRGPGEVLGARQSGLLRLRIADVVRDQDLLPAVEAAAREMKASAPERIELLIQRWVGDEALQLGDV
ncbi:MAG TPA: ATP-dependent DNA helicase RecG [Gammaproteobacteria bacterium]|nr:ATP-dependent DNA helicase RecG [Gammaproteobacteria bacterium]